MKNSEWLKKMRSYLKKWAVSRRQDLKFIIYMVKDLKKNEHLVEDLKVWKGLYMKGRWIFMKI